MKEDMQTVNFSLLSDVDLHLFNEGSHFHLYDKLGAHPTIVDGIRGVYFAVWAPNAKEVRVMGDFNDWNRTKNPLRPRGSSGIWEGFLPGIKKGSSYKYFIRSHRGGHVSEKADPFGFFHEIPPKTASRVWELDYAWRDARWMENRTKIDAHKSPVSILEVHLGSFMRKVEENNRPLTYRELAPKLANYAREQGYTHIELMPIMEHPFYGSWGYQVTGYFAPTSRYGTPQDFMYFVDHLHQQGIGVILDWVPSHFPTDGHGLAYFDGTHLFEHADPKQGFHPDWASSIFNYGRHEIRSFLTSSAFFWIDKFHIDGLRVDAVASMLYLDYSRKYGEWIPNVYGGRENLDAVDFIRRLNIEVYKHFPGVQMIAEESTAWGAVSKPTYVGGLGFGFKWDMGWMHDTLVYMGKEPVHRKYHHNEITFRMIYAFTENFILSLSHDEVVHGKRSLIEKMPGDDWQKFANLRLLFAYMFAQPGKKLLFMGSDIAQRNEWHHETSLDWHLLQHISHQGIQKEVQALNKIYATEPALYSSDCEPEGFEWIDGNDGDNSVLTFIRKDPKVGDVIAVACNFTPVPRYGYRIGVPHEGRWKEIMNSDAKEYWGSGMGNLGTVHATNEPFHWRPYSMVVTLPPLAAVYFKHEG